MKEKPSTKRRVCVIGCLGKMGQVTCRGLLSGPDFELAAAVDIAHPGEDLGEISHLGHIGLPIADNLQSILAQEQLDFAIDFTTPHTVVNNVALCLQAKVPVLVGTTGWTEEDLEKIRLLSNKMETAVLVVPNFAIGAVLMMEFARKAAKYMPHAEIIEMHNPLKLDKPSGTAKRTRELMLKAMGKTDDDDSEHLIPIHSVRLPGLVAHQEVIFGELGQSLKIRHDSFQRESFVPGILLGLKQLSQSKGLKIGLEL